MKKRLLAVAVSCLVGLCALPQAFADDNIYWEFSGATNSTLAFFNTLGNTTTDFNIQTVAQYFITPSIELGLGASYSILSTDQVTEHGVDGGVELTFNFLGTKPADSFFVTLVPGITSNSKGLSDGTSADVNQLTLGVALGKRFAITDHVAWKPQVSFDYEGSANYTDPTLGAQSIAASHQFTITPFQFAILL